MAIKKMYTSRGGDRYKQILFMNYIFIAL